MIARLIEAALQGLGMMMAACLFALAAIFLHAYIATSIDRWKLSRRPRACRSCSTVAALNKHGRCKACEWVTANWYELEFHFAKVVLEVRQIVWERKQR